jgi:late competence protein required for DNA uptake (superfamily II DNA/RNA helicase)
MIVKCNRCGREVPAENSYQHLGEVLCEDCYIDVRYPAKACDPWAVYSATRSRESAGLKGTEGLTELQKKI